MPLLEMNDPVDPRRKVRVDLDFRFMQLGKKVVGREGDDEQCTRRGQDVSGRLTLIATDTAECPCGALHAVVD